MNEHARRFLVAAAVLGGLAVVAGAFGAHTLEGHVPAERLAAFETAARYAMYHALALVGVSLLIERGAVEMTLLAWCGRLFVAGVVLFSGSLAVLVLADAPALGIVTPFGGACFLAGWSLLGLGAWRKRKTPDGEGPPGV